MDLESCYIWIDEIKEKLKSDLVDDEITALDTCQRLIKEKVTGYSDDTIGSKSIPFCTITEFRSESLESNLRYQPNTMASDGHYFPITSNVFKTAEEALEFAINKGYNKEQIYLFALSLL